MIINYSMVQDIIDCLAKGDPDFTIKDAIRLAYFRGLSHSDDKKEILDRELNAYFADLKNNQQPTGKG